MALSNTAVEDLPALGDELPCVTPHSEFQLEDAERFREANLAVLLRGEKTFQIPASSSDRKLSDPMFWIDGPIRILGGEALVMMYVTVQHYVCVDCV